MQRERKTNIFFSIGYFQNTSIPISFASNTSKRVFSHHDRRQVIHVAVLPPNGEVDKKEFEQKRPAEHQSPVTGS